MSPYDVPNSTFLAANLDKRFRAGCEAVFQVLGASNSEAADTLSTFLQTFAEPEELRAAATDNRTTEDENSHDRYFQIKRIYAKSDGPKTAYVLARSIVAATATLYLDAAESAFSTPAQVLHSLHLALTDLLSTCLNSKIAPVELAWRTHEDAEKCHSMRRWIRGHQLFAVLTQGLILAFSEMRDAARLEDWAAVARWVDLAEKLLVGSGASFEFTGDFPAKDYCELIRPTMQPPFVGESFSGLLAVDHRCFVHLLKEMKAELDAVHEHDERFHARLAAAMSQVYDRHKHVCERFVGTRPSLMTAVSSGKSGGDQIERFKAVRMKSFESKSAVNGKCPFARQEVGTPVAQ